MSRHIYLGPEDPQWPTPEERASRPACVQGPTTSYLHFQAESSRRHSAGERQQRCRICGLFYWPRWPKDAAKHGVVVNPDSARPAAPRSPCLSCPVEEV